MTHGQETSLPAERKHQRASCEFAAEFSWGTISNPATILIISIGGCYLNSEAVVPVGEELEIAFRTEPGGPPVVCRARVAWVSTRGIRIRERTPRRGFALEFLSIFPEHRARIEDYVRKQNRLFRGIEHELAKKKPDRDLVKELFRQARPGESTHLAHVKMVTRNELRYFRLRR